MQGQAVEHCGAVALQTGRGGVQVRQVVGADLADPVVETVAVEAGPADGWSGGPGPCRRHGGVITRNRRHQHRDRARLKVPATLVPNAAACSYSPTDPAPRPSARPPVLPTPARSPPTSRATPACHTVWHRQARGPVPRRSGRRTSRCRRTAVELAAESALGGHRSPHHLASARIDCAPARPDNCSLDTPTARRRHGPEG